MQRLLHGVKVLEKDSKGVQQGSLLSPLIWSVYFEKWLSLQMGPVSPKAFCDDSIMLLTGHDQYSMVDIMQQAIGKTMEFGVQKGLKFNPKKTQVMFFQRKNKFKWPILKCTYYFRGNTSITLAHKARRALEWREHSILTLTT